MEVADRSIHWSKCASIRSECIVQIDAVRVRVLMVVCLDIAASSSNEH